MPAHDGSFFPEPETTFLMALSGNHQAQGEGCFLGCALLWVGAVQELWLMQALLTQGVTVISLQAGEGREPGCQLLSADPHYFPFFLFEIKSN